MKPIKMLAAVLSVTAAGFAIGEYDFTDNVAPSQTPPGGIPVDKAPMFITLGVDDLDMSGDSEDDQEIGPMGIRYLMNFFESKQNPAGAGNAATFDGSPARISFYLTSVYLAQQGADNPNLIKWILNEAWSKGFEIGLHSHTHGEQIKSGSKSYLMESEIQTCIDWLTKPLPPKTQETYVIESSQGAGIPLEDISGWRTPFLAYGNDMLPALKEKGVTYDCSIEEGNNTWEQDGTNFRWPYTMDNGSPGHIEGWSGNPDNPDAITVPNIPGFWQLPNHVAMLPPDELCAQYGLDYSIRQKMYDNLTAKSPSQTWYKENTDRFTNFDYNFWHQFGLSGKDVTAILKYTLDVRLAGNRAPLMIGAHDGWFHKTKDATPGIKADYLERQKAYADFFEYALTKPEVRIVTGRDIIKWCQNPVALDDIHYRINLTVTPDTALTPGGNNYPAWDETKRYETPTDTVSYNGHLWYPAGWHYDNLGKIPGQHEYWIDGGFNGTVEVSTPGKVVRDADIVRKGESITFRFVPDAGYQVSELRVNGEWVDPAESFTFSGVQDNQDLQVKFSSGPVGIEQNQFSRVKTMMPVATGIVGNQLNLSVPTEGSYDIALLGLNGRKLYEGKVDLSAGVSSIELNGISLSSQMVLVQISSKTVQSVQKLLIK